MGHGQKSPALGLCPEVEELGARGASAGGPYPSALGLVFTRMQHTVMPSSFFPLAFSESFYF